MTNDNSYVAKMEAQLNEWKTKIGDIKARVEKEGRLEMRKHVADFETRFGDVGRRFDELRTAGEGTATAVKAGLEIAWDTFKVEFDKVKL